MTDQTAKTGPATEHATARAFNDYHVVGAPVRYWKGVREGDGKVARTRTEAQLLGGHTAVVWLEGVSGCIALTHIQPITEEELAAAERIPAPRPIPTTRQRLTDARACGHTPEQHRHDDGQDADAASHDRAMRVLAAERDAITAENTQWQAEIAHLRDLIRQYGADGKIPVSAISKALCDGPSPSLGSVSPHAQDGHSQGYAEAIAHLRDDARYMHWWSSTGVQPAGPLRQHLADYLETVGLAETPRRLLNQAIAASLPVAGGRVAELLAALRAELAEVDAKRAAVNELRQG